MNLRLLGTKVDMFVLWVTRVRTANSKNGEIMEKTSRRALCVWLVAPSTGGIRKVRIGGSWILAASITLGSICGLFGCVFFDYVQVTWNQATSNYNLTKVMQERDFLINEKRELEAELEQVRVESAQAHAFKHDVNKKMNELFAVVEASTGLGFMKGGTLNESKPPRRGSGSLTVARRSDAPGQRLRQINKGLGGAEIECRRDARGKVTCTSSAKKQDVSLDDVEASLRPAVISADGQSWSEDKDKEDLTQRLEMYTTVLRSLPIGWPIRGDVTSGFGYRISPFTGRASVHEGMDVSVKTGTKVRVTGDGVVERVERDGAYGLLVDVVHLDGVMTRYAHLSSSPVRVGQKVTRGQVIALSGCTGRSTGPHLHYEVRVNGRARNPNSFVALANKLRRFLA